MFGIFYEVHCNTGGLKCSDDTAVQLFPENAIVLRKGSLAWIFTPGSKKGKCACGWNACKWPTSSPFIACVLYTGSTTAGIETAVLAMHTSSKLSSG